MSEDIFADHRRNIVTISDNNISVADKVNAIEFLNKVENLGYDAPSLHLTTVCLVCFWDECGILFSRNSCEFYKHKVTQEIITSGMFDLILKENKKLFHSSRTKSQTYIDK